MIITAFISSPHTVLFSDTSKVALDLMLGMGSFELPVLREGRLVGHVAFEDCLKSSNISEIIKEGFLSIYEKSHTWDALAIFAKTSFTSAAVLDKNGELVGVLAKKDIVNYFGQSITTEQQGAILLLETSAVHYSSSEICRLVEAERAQVLGLWIHPVLDSGRIRVSIKLNTHHAEAIASSLGRFNYEVITSFGDVDYAENVERRFQSFLNYLEI